MAVAGITSGLGRPRPVTAAVLTPVGARHLAIERATAADFAGLVGSTFQLRQRKGGLLGVVLMEVEPHAASLHRPLTLPRQEPFSLVFSAPGHATLPQRTYTLRHARLGRFDVFLVPVGPAGEETQLEAVFA